MTTDRLLAKSYQITKYPKQPPDYALLTQHESDVAQACKALATNVGKAAVFNAGLNPQIIDDFDLALRANGWIQDTGKSSSHFQSMVKGESITQQLLRHETISSILFLQNDQLRQWIDDERLNKIKLIAIWGAIGHHRKFDYSTSANTLLPSLTVYVTHPDFQMILEEMGKDLELAEPPRFERDIVIASESKEDGDISADEALEDLFFEFEKYESEFGSEQNRRFLALVKAFGIAADVSASAVAGKYQSGNLYSLDKWIEQDLKIALSVDELDTLIHTYAWKSRGIPRKKWKLDRLPDGFSFRDFQNNVAASPSYLTLAAGGCGSGKSLAAYLWAKKWAEKLKDKRNFRLFFCLPTTGTTTEHFKEYALESGIDEGQISLTHSRSSVDLETMATTLEREEVEEDKDTDVENKNMALQVIKAEQDKIDALKLWSTKLSVTTTDTVLGLMANARRSIYSIPAIMQSAIIFDEIHAFDDRLFGHLLVFLKNFPKLPVLLMTASLPDNRLKAIQQIRPDLNFVPGDSKLETLPRYLLEYQSVSKSAWEEEKLWQKVAACIASKGKVLWICNRVDWANNTYLKAGDRFPNTSVNVYHSRLCYKHRSRRHRNVVDLFKQSKQPAILVSTQVAEMSLDISADLLITDVAPIPSIIQRLGRLNRRVTPNNPGSPKTAIICSLVNPKHDTKPYGKEELKLTKIWLERLQSFNRPLHQKDLADVFSEVSEVEEFNYQKAERAAVFFSGLWKTRPGTTRSEGYTISVILQQHYEQCDEWQYGKPTADWLRKHEVSIPFKEPVFGWEKIEGAGIRIAPTEAVSYDYNEDTQEGMGAAWR
ncbi:MAG: CRISPR-associated helicase Cas3' [Cyanobacteria bacterium J06621_8]